MRGKKALWNMVEWGTGTSESKFAGVVKLVYT